MLIELGLVHALWNSIEVGEKICSCLAGFVFALASFAQQVVYQNLGLNLLLDIQRRRIDDQICPVLLVFASPDQLRIEVPITAFIFYANRIFLSFLQDGLVFRRRDV